MSKSEYYKELVSTPIQDKREIVISEFSSGGYTLAQRLNVEEGNKKTSVYMKNSIHIDTVDGLVNLRDALNVALDKINVEN